MTPPLPEDFRLKVRKDSFRLLGPAAMPLNLFEGLGAEAGDLEQVEHGGAVVIQQFGVER